MLVLRPEGILQAEAEALFRGEDSDDTDSDSDSNASDESSRWLREDSCRSPFLTFFPPGPRFFPPPLELLSCSNDVSAFFLALPLGRGATGGRVVF